MADKPSRALVIYGDGLAPFLDQSHTHLHSLASLSSCSFLGLPLSPPSETEEKRMIRELAILFDAFHSSLDGSGDDAEVKIKSIPERFMGMRTAILTNNLSLRHFGSELGASLLQLEELMKSNNLADPIDDFLASELLKKLGFQDGKVQDTSEFDLLFVHIGAGVGDMQDGIALDKMKYIDTLVGSILQKARPGSEIGCRLHLSLVMSYGDVFKNKDDECSLSILTTEDVRNSDLSALFPRQSYTMKGESQRNDVRNHSPMLLAQWQYGVTRKDKAETFSFKEFKERGGNLVIPADRFLHEVAFKLWKAPKYGA